MPNQIKILLSVTIAFVAIAAFFFQDRLGQVGPKWATAVLGVGMIVSMWVFPEVTRSANQAKEPGRPVSQPGPPPMGL